MRTSPSATTAVNRQRRSLARLIACCAGVVLVTQPLLAGASTPRTGVDSRVIETLPVPGMTHRSKATTVSKSRGCHRLPRATRDRPDLRRGRLVHVIYLVPADADDEALDTDGTLDCSARAQNQWFEEQSGGLRWRFDSFRTKVRTGGGTRAVEVTDVTFVRSSLPGAALSGAFEVKDELTKLGFDDSNKRYLSFVASEAAPCGDALYPIAPPGTWVDGQYAQVYLFSTDGCRAHEFGVPGAPSWAEMIAQQELIHNDGLTSPGAPHGCLGGIPPGFAHVCTGPLFATEGSVNLDPERVDVMYPYVSVPLSEKVLDRGNDDYFGHPFPHLFDLEDTPYVERVS